MSPLVPAADREHLSRVRASLAQDGFDLAMIGHDRLQLLAYAATIAIELADQGDWQVEKYDPTQLETLLADFKLTHFDGALAPAAMPFPDMITAINASAGSIERFFELLGISQQEK